MKKANRFQRRVRRDAEKGKDKFHVVLCGLCVSAFSASKEVFHG